MIEVVTVFAGRDEYPRWRDYLPLLDLQRRTVERVGHRHVVVSDAPIEGFNCFLTELPESLMHLQLEGQLAYLRQWGGEDHVVLVDADCLVGRDLRAAFDGRFDIGLTRRDNESSPINNGAMYIAAGAQAAAVAFFTRALGFCKEHWGGDQEAIAQAAAPVPRMYTVKRRNEARIAFLSMRSHNVTPEKEGARHAHSPFVVHFKGDRKHWMRRYAEEFLLAPVTAT